MKKAFLTQFAPLQVFTFFFTGSMFFYLYKPYAQSMNEVAFIRSSAGNNKINQALNIDSGYAEVNGTKLYYEVAGRGQSLVFIHGSFGDRRHWDFQCKEFSKKYKVLRYDVRGYGKSALPNPDKTYTDAEDLNGLMDFLKIRKVHICGLSMGSVISIDFALSHPDKCGSLIVIGPPGCG